jgi:acyl-coenzyme A synthetase/AMP-(fatty) acid ligase
VVSNGIDASDWLVDRHIRQCRGKAAAFRTGRRSLNYGELADQIAGVAGMFRGFGVGVGDRAA